MADVTKRLPVQLHLNHNGRGRVVVDGSDISSHVSRIEVVCDVREGTRVLLTLPGAEVDVDGLAAVTGITRRPFRGGTDGG